MQVASISVYPVKSMRGVDLPSAAVEREGLRHDRRWMVVDAAGENITSRTHPVMLSITAVPDDDGGVTLGISTQSPLHVPAPGGEPAVRVTLSRLPTAVSAGAAADAWVSAAIGEAVRLVWLDDPARRPVGVSHGGQAGEPLSLADAGPLLLTTTASLALLGDWIAAAGDEEAAKIAPISMQRFRPSVVVDGSDVQAFAEDHWRRVRIGDVEFRFGEICDRCSMTTIDPVTLVSGKEPIRTLARHRRWDGKVWFGVRLIPTSTGLVSVGDEVTAS